MRFTFAILLALAFAPGVNAYTGPGLGLGIIGTVVGILFSLLLAILAIFWYPLKRLWKTATNKTEAEDDSSEEEPPPLTKNPSDSV
jgi:hypothetical protein